MTQRTIATNWFKPPTGYGERIGENRGSLGRTAAECNERQRLPTLDFTCGLRPWETEYFSQYSALRPILPPRKYREAGNNNYDCFSSRNGGRSSRRNPFSGTNGANTFGGIRRGGVSGLNGVWNGPVGGMSAEQNTNTFGGILRADGTVVRGSWRDPKDPNTNDEVSSGQNPNTFGGILRGNGPEYDVRMGWNPAVKYPGSNVMKAYIPEEGSRRSRFRPLEVVPKATIERPDALSKAEEESERDGGRDALMNKYKTQSREFRKDNPRQKGGSKKRRSSDSSSGHYVLMTTKTTKKTTTTIEEHHSDDDD